MLSNEDIRQIILKMIDCYQNDKKIIVVKKNKFEFICYEECMHQLAIKERNSSLLESLIEEELNKLLNEEIFLLDSDNNIYLAKYLPDKLDFKLSDNTVS